ncbi:MAG: hypothetical protein M3Z01_09440, partial [Thermoproteota archaeon]|nr:hypothetical protein [Thermoproteota archaeon]
LNIRSGISELIKDGETGFLVNDRTDHFINAIKNLQSDKNIWHAISKAARNKIINEYSEEVCNKKWMDFLLKLSEDKKEVIHLIIPDKNELHALYYPAEFKVASNPAPSSVVAPLYKLKALAGRIKRKFLQSHYN